MLSLFSGSMALANDYEGNNKTTVSVSQSQAGEKKAVIKINNLHEGERSYLKIRDKGGRLVYAETIYDAPSFAKVYDLSAIESNTYVIELKNKNEVVKETLDMQAEKPAVPYFKPVVRTENKMIKVVFQNPLASPVYVSLYDQAGRWVYRAKVDEQQIYAHGLDLSTLNSRDFVLSLTGKDYRYSQNLRLRY